MALRKDGFGRDIVLCLVHADGHVGALANEGVVETTVVQLHALYSLLGVPGWATQMLPVEDAVRAHLEAVSCRVCALVFECGCSWQRVVAGQCPHGTAHRVHALSHVVGYCANDRRGHRGPPLPVWLRVYEPGARYGHLATGLADAATCGYTPTARTWMGAATEHERAVALRLPVCRACTRLLGVTPGTREDGASGDS